MECNKEEAVRARDIAEKKLQSRDFPGARKFALKAQQLFPDLENINHIITVCEVHCSSAKKINADLLDWYGILQLEPTADELSIKKQYRKLALLLHPDKNKFTGAEAAFKLIGEAHRTLTDKAKRQSYDLKRGSPSMGISAPKPQPHAPNGTFTKFVPNTFQSNAGPKFSNVNPQSGQHRPPPADGARTFWTKCLFCGVKYEYYRNVMLRTLQCQNCKRTFVAHEVNTRGGARVAPHVYTSVNPTMNVKTQASEPNSNAGNATTRQGEGLVNNTKEENNKESEFVKVNLKKKEKKVAEASVGSKRKRSRKRVVDSSSEDAEESSDSEEEIFEEVEDVAAGDINTSAARNSGRRSTRQKQNVKYNEQLSDEDDFVNPPKGEPNGSSHDGAAIHDVEKKVESQQVQEEDDQGDFAEEGPDIFTFPDPEFYSFDEHKTVGSFAAGQVWALYDDIDGMPRFYAKIKNVLKPDFHVRYNWLECIPSNQVEKNWCDRDMPVACGNFKIGTSQDAEELAMFSHVMAWEKGKKNQFVMNPRKGEVWAVYKDWNIKLTTKTFQYEIVEVLTDTVEGSAVSIAPLIKVKEYVCVFARVSSNVVQIQPHEMLKFSHLVPSFRLTGAEADGIRDGFYELDPAALSPNFTELLPSMSLDQINENLKHNANKSEEKAEPHKKRRLRRNQATVLKEEDNVLNDAEVADTPVEIQDSTPSPRFTRGSSRNNQNGTATVPATVEGGFHDFESDRSQDKFEKGQLWAVYGDDNNFPRYHALIKGVDVRNNKAHVIWLQPRPSSPDELKWGKKNLPFCCGIFKSLPGSEVSFAFKKFSHHVKNAAIGTRDLYSISPQVGEVWAIYRNWSVEWQESDVRNSEYDLGEIISATKLVIQVMLLVKKKGYNSVFMPKKVDGRVVTLDIPLKELLRFSHLVPSFRLNKVGVEALGGCWALDPASVPKALLCTSD